MLLDASASSEAAGIASRSAASWKDWARHAAKNGGSLAHRWVRAATETSRVSAGAGNTAPRTAQQRADDALLEWQGHWGSEAQGPECGFEWPGSGGALERPGLGDFRRTLLSFRGGTALSVDALHPRAVGLLVDADLELLLDFLMEIEELGMFPDTDLITVVLLDKVDGGQRPIGLMPFLARVLGRCRRPVVKRWEQEVRKAYHVDRCDVANWDLALRAEHAAVAKLSDAAIFLDLKKCYEYVQHHQLAVECKAGGFPWKVVRTCVASYRLRRVVKVGEAYSKPFCANRTIVAGCAHATALLKAYLRRGLESTVQRWPQVHLEEVVDDLSLQRISTSGARVADDLVGAAQHLAGFTKDLGLQLQGKKCAIVARDSRLTERLVSRLKALGIGRRFAVRIRGSDFAGGSRRSTVVREKRINRAKVMGPRLRALRKAGVNATGLFNTGAASGALWGGCR